MTEPLTKEERRRLVAAAMGRPDEELTWVERDLLRYEVTVAALEAEIARLRPLAEAVEGMAVGDGLFREGENEWRVRSDLEYETSNWEIVDNAPTPLAAFEAMKQKRAEYEAAVARADDAALRAAKGESHD